MHAGIARVMVDIAHTNVDKTFDYRIPPHLKEDVVPGMRVFVPFGAGDRQTEAFVVEVDSCTGVPAEKLKDVTSRIDRYPALWPEQIGLARFMQERYGCLFVEALRLMMPAQLRRRPVEGRQYVTVSLNVDALRAREESAALFKRAPLQARVLEILTDIGQVSLADLEAIQKGGAGAARTLEKKGLLKREAVRIARRPYAALRAQKRTRPVLNPRQQQAVHAACAALEEGGGEFLLHGVTGSGKTEVYMHVIEACRKKGRSALVLVPEIALTPQIMAQFAARFGDDVALLHSRLSAGERLDEWERIVTGKAKVVIGARSAVFAPLRDIGVIVVDEEQENSYHSQIRPRYHAADIARERMKAHGAVLMLCSATPSLETYHRALQGRARLIRLPQRVQERPLPTVEVVDMREEIKRGNRSVFSAALYHRMKETLERGEQAMLFVNRRGYSTQIVCLHCGKALRCGQCDVSLTFHQNPPRALCHYCHKEYPLQKTCRHCGAEYFQYQGVGTQKVEKQMLSLFPDVSLIRMDLNTMQKKDAHVKAQQDFETGRAQVLIGTQMIAKGLDFKNVALVGVVAADATLLLPDYKSAERAFQLITQVAGRAGRGDVPGRVVVQTYNPDHPAILCAKEQDYERFYRGEITARRACLYPPFAAFARYLVTGEDRHAVKTGAASLYGALQAAFSRDDAVKPLLFRASPAPLERIRGVWRYEIVLKFYEDDLAQCTPVLWETLRCAPVQGCRFDLEIRPVNMV
ncbi:MAG: replication restart helicase PriA [Bacillota bacterium]